MIVNQLCINQFCGATLALVAALLILVAGSPINAQAATVPFTFELTYDVFVVGVPSPTTLTLPTTTSGSGSYCAFRQCDLLGNRNSHVRNVTFR